MKKADIKFTNDYPIFTKIRGNRPINKNGSYYLGLKESIQKIGQIYPLVVTQSMEVVDGQHRLEIARELGLPVSYLVLPDGINARQYVVELNVNKKNWGLTEYLGYHQSDPYRIFRDLYKRCNMSVNSVHILLTGSLLQGASATAFKEGLFTFSNTDLMNFEIRWDKLKNLIEVKDGKLKSRLTAAKLLWGLVRLMDEENYRQERMVDVLLTNPDYKLPTVNNLNDGLRILESLYNASLKKGRVNLGKYIAKD